MAKKSSKRRGKKGFVAIPFVAELALSTLGAGVVTAVDALGAALGEDLYCISVDSWASIISHTPAEGPLVCGYAHSDLTVAEVAECLSAELTDPDDIIAKERSRRPVRKTGVFSGIASDENLNNGQVIRTKLKFSVGDGHNLAFWVMNSDGDTLTTGTVVKVSGTLYGRWQR